MKKFVLIILMSSIFLYSCSSRNGVDGDVFCNKIANMVKRSDDDKIQFLDNNTNFSYTEKDKNFANILISKGFTKNETHVMVSITHENYSNVIESIKFNGGHFWYIHNGQTNLNCGIFAVIRLLYHLGLQGIVDKDLWYKNNITQLRKIAAFGGAEFENENVMLPESIVLNILRHVDCPEPFVKIKRVGSTYESEAKKQIAILENEIRFFEDILSSTPQEEMISRIESGYYDNPLAGQFYLTKEALKNYCLNYPGNKTLLGNGINFNKEEINKYQKMIETGDYKDLNL